MQQVTGDTQHVTTDNFFFFCIGATFHTRQEIQCLPYDGFNFFEIQYFDGYIIDVCLNH